jgi:hypothetical protein
MNNTEQIIQKCYGITHWAVLRGRATLKKDRREFDRCDVIVNDLVQKLIKVIKDDS